MSPQTAKILKPVLQLAILVAALVACLHFVYDNGLVGKDAVTTIVVSVVAALIKLLDTGGSKPD